MISLEVSICSSRGIVYAPVLPVPFLALARMSLPDRAMGMLASCMGLGFSQPFSNIPIKSSLFRQKSSNSLPLVSVTSVVFILLSLGGSFSWAFHPLRSCWPIPACSCCCCDIVAAIRRRKAVLSSFKSFYHFVVIFTPLGGYFSLFKQL